jgi:Tol biopolymer transport system component
MLALAGVCLSVSDGAAVGTTTRVSVDSAGVAGNAGSSFPAISDDGRFVAFESDATNLVPNDTNYRRDIFVYDRQTVTTERVSLTTTGAEANADSFYPEISEDGRYVVFESLAPNLVPGDTNGVRDVFVRDRLMAITERVSVSTAGTQGNAASSAEGAAWPVGAAAISANGRYVVFQSDASNLVAGDTNGVSDVFLRDRVAGTTERIGEKGISPAINSDGRYIAYSSQFPDPNTINVYLYDRQTLGTTQVTDGNNFSLEAKISADGRYVAFQSHATTFASGDNNHGPDTFIYDAQTTTISLVSRTPAGVPGNGQSNGASISSDGRYVVFGSAASDLEPGGSPGAYRYDVQAQTLARVGDGGNFPDVSADGGEAAFHSILCGLVPGDTQNNILDVFVHEIGGAASSTDADCDGVAEPGDNCPSVPNADQADFDGDTVGDDCDNCLLVTNGAQADADSDGIGDICDADLPDVDGARIDVEEEATPMNTATTVGSVDWCRSIDNNDVLDADEDGIDSIIVDIVVPGAGIPAASGLTAFKLQLSYSITGVAPFLKVTAADAVKLLGSNIGSAVNVSSDSLPDADGLFTLVARDLGAGVAESGDGILVRLTMEANSNQPVRNVPAIVSVSWVGQNGAMYDDTNPNQTPSAQVMMGGSCSATDTDNDWILNLADNCPSAINVDQADADGDLAGDACDTDDDNDGLSDSVDGPACGSNGLNAASLPERVDGPYAGVDDDGDGLIDELTPHGFPDCDRDGYSSATENHVFSYLGQLNGDQKTCQEYDMSFPNSSQKPSKRWPSDLNGTPFSFNKINISDLAAFSNPIRYVGNPVGTNPGDVRFDLANGSGINVSDMARLTVGPTGFPPMLGGARAFNGPVCPTAP